MRRHGSMPRRFFGLRLVLPQGGGGGCGAAAFLCEAILKIVAVTQRRQETFDFEEALAKEHLTGAG